MMPDIHDGTDDALPQIFKNAEWVLKREPRGVVMFTQTNKEGQPLFRADVVLQFLKVSVIARDEHSTKHLWISRTPLPAWNTLSTSSSRPR